MKIKIDKSIGGVLPNIRLGILEATVEVFTSTEALNEQIVKTCEDLNGRLDNASLKEIPALKSSRTAYKLLGKEPSRYRLSAEALLRRVISGKGLYQINNIVDLLNLISIETGFSIGGYDASLIEGDILLKKGGTEVYNAIGRGVLNIDCMPTLYDEKGAFGTPTSDSTRTCTSDSTKKFLLIFYDFDGEGSLSEAIEKTIALLKDFAKGVDFNTFTVKFEDS